MREALRERVGKKVRYVAASALKTVVANIVFAVGCAAPVCCVWPDGSTTGVAEYLLLEPSQALTLVSDWVPIGAVKAAADPRLLGVR
mmetsp:Transcript_4243/g.9901  ORF Transcript_4243/g.9901 Transcript_4243/m.9901 type:complete len:87 (-) Transcript_4243:300-560(-)